MLSFNHVIGVFLFVLATLNQVQAEFCGRYNGYDWYCYDSNTYCCGFQDGTGLCCRYSPFYTWWYFWLIIAGVLVFISSAIACCRRSRMRNQMQAANTIRIQSAVVASQQPNTFQNPISPQTVEAPPMYSPQNAGFQNLSEQPPPAYQPDDFPGQESKQNYENVQ